jgi:transcriptional regulator with XRE-family HTH domain
MPIKPSPLAQFLRAEMDRQGVTQVELERRTGIPDATLGRILKDEVDEVKGSQLNKIAVALGLPFWRLWTLAGITSELPLDPSEEARQLAASVPVPKSYTAHQAFEVASVAPKGGQVFTCDTKQNCDAIFAYFDALKALAGPYTYQSPGGTVVAQLNSGLKPDEAAKFAAAIASLP